MGVLNKAKAAAPDTVDPEQAAPEADAAEQAPADPAEQAPDAPTGDQAPADNSAQPDQALGGADEASAGKGDPNVRMATPEEQKQYMAALAMLYKIMYINEGSAMSLVKHIDPKDKMGSIIKAVMVMVQQMNSKMKMLPPVLAQITQDATDRMLEIAERIKKLSYTKQETLVLLAATQDAVEKATGTVSGDTPSAPVAGGQSTSQPDQAAQPADQQAAPATAPSPDAAPAPAGPPPGAQ